MALRVEGGFLCGVGRGEGVCLGMVGSEGKMEEGVKGYEGMCTELVEWLSVMRGDGGKGAEEVVMRSLEKAVVKMFDGRRVDEQFVNSGEPPRWLRRMMNSERWIPTIRNLARDHLVSEASVGGRGKRAVCFDLIGFWGAAFRLLCGAGTVSIAVRFYSIAGIICSGLCCA